MRSTPSTLVLILAGTMLLVGGVERLAAQSGTSVPQAAPAAPSAATADRSPAMEPRAHDEERRLQRLKGRVEERWRIVRVREGLVLVPRRSSEKLRGIELTRNEVLVDGLPVTGAELRERLGGDGETILSLSYLDEATRLALFEPAARTAAPVAMSPSLSGPASSPQSDPAFHERRRGARVRIGSNVAVSEHERIDGAVVAILGSVQVDGEVREEVVAVGGSVRLGPKAQVRGDVVSVGGRIEIDPQARVQGVINEVAIAWPQGWDHVSVSPGIQAPVWPGRDWWAGMSYLATSVRLGLIGLLGVIAVLLGGRTYERVRREVERTPWQALLVGVGTQLLLLPLVLLVCVTLLVSVIGIPLLALVPIALVVLVALWLLGFAAVGERIGQRLASGLGAGDVPPVVGFLIGFVVVTGLAWLTRVAWWGAWLGGGTVFVLGAVGAVIEGLAWAAGLGGVVLAWLRRDRTVLVTPPPLAATVDGPATL